MIDCKILLPQTCGDTDSNFANFLVQELNELQTVAAPEHLKTHRIAQTVQSNRFPVRLSAYSFELLAAFLTSAKPLALLLAIINEHLNVRVCPMRSSGRPTCSMQSTT